MAQERGKPFSSQLRERLAGIERRDWELWVLALVTVAILAAGLFFVLLPAVFLGQRSIQIRANLSPQLMLGLVLLVLLLIAYLVHKQMQLRALRLRSIVEAWNFEVAHIQMLIDPLTQVFNRSSLEEILGREIKRVHRKQSTLVSLRGCQRVQAGQYALRASFRGLGAGRGGGPSEAVRARLGLRRAHGRG
jgi:hypothetical protein